MALLRDAARQGIGGNAFDGLLAGGIDVEDEERVGIGKGGGEFVHQVAGAGVAVRLKDDMQAAEPALAGRGQGGSDLGGMMTVIVNHADSGSLPAKLEAAIDPAETVEGSANLVRGNVERGADGNGGGGIEHVVNAGDVQGELAQVLFAPFFLLMKDAEMTDGCIARASFAQVSAHRTGANLGHRYQEVGTGGACHKW